MQVNANMYDTYSSCDAFGVLQMQIIYIVTMLMSSFKGNNIKRVVSIKSRNIIEFSLFFGGRTSISIGNKMLKMELIVVYNSVPVLPHAYFIYLFISFYNPYIVCAWIGAIKLGDLQSTRFLNFTIYNQTTLCAILSIYLCVHSLLCGLTINHTIKSTSLNGKISSSSSYGIFLRIYYVLFTFLL